jgi:hypothetical protein
MLTLLAMAAVANNVDEMMNSPEIKPIKPVKKTAPVKISLYKSFMSKPSYKVEKFFDYGLTIIQPFIVDNNTGNIWIVSLFDTLNS